MCVCILLWGGDVRQRNDKLLSLNNAFKKIRFLLCANFTQIKKLNVKCQIKFLPKKIKHYGSFAQALVFSSCLDDLDVWLRKQRLSFCLTANFILVQFKIILIFKFENINEIKALIYVSVLAVKKNPSPAEGASLWEEGFII